MYEKQSKLITPKVIEVAGIWLAVIILGSAYIAGLLLQK